MDQITCAIRPEDELSGADDEVSVDGGALQRLSTLLRESGGHVRLCAAVLSMTFAET